MLSRQRTWQQTCLCQLSFSWERTAGVGIKNSCVYQAPPFFCPFTSPFRLSRSNPVSCQGCVPKLAYPSELVAKTPLTACRKSSSRREEALTFLSFLRNLSLVTSAATRARPALGVSEKNRREDACLAKLARQLKRIPNEKRFCLHFDEGDVQFEAAHSQQTPQH